MAQVVFDRTGRLLPEVIRMRSARSWRVLFVLFLLALPVLAENEGKPLLEFREGRQTGRCRALKAKDGGQSKIDEVVVSGRAGISVPVSHRRFEMGAEMPITGFQPFHTQVPAQGSAVAQALPCKR